MNKILLKMKIKYESLSKSEKQVADYLMDNPVNVLPMHITDLARECNTSESTIVRFSKKLGFNGYPQLKLALAGEASSHSVSESISTQDSAYKIFEKVCEDIYCSLEKTKHSLKNDSLQACCERLLKANQIFIFGLGNSASVALDAAHKIFRLGLNAVAYTDNHMQTIAAAHTDKNSVVIGISHSGHSKDIVQALQIAKKFGAFTISLTSRQKSPVARVSDLILSTVSDETNYRILGLCSRITQLAIIDTIYSYLVCHLENAKENISKIENTLSTKKI